VPLAQIDARYQEKPYYVVPRGPVAQEAFAVIREAMAGQRMAGLGHVVLSSRERPIAIHPRGLGLQGVTLRYPYEVRGEAEYFEDIQPLTLPQDMIGIARHIVTTMKADFDPGMLQDRERAVIVDLLKDKQRALPGPTSRKAKAEPSRTNIVSLMDALKRSLAAEGKSEAGGKRRKRAKAQT
jgi:DNA end-binding protein Ku